MTSREARRILLTVLIPVLMPALSAAKQFKLPPLETFIADTLHIVVEMDSLIDPAASHLDVRDSRPLGAQILGIRQTNKYKYIPVDQYLYMDQSMADVFKQQFVQDSLNLRGTIHLSQLVLWTDNQQALEKGLCLNAYTTYHDTLGHGISDWIWELRVKREKQEEEDAYLKRVILDLARQQSSALKEARFNPEFYPHLFRRQLMTWAEFIAFADGYALNVHFTLDFPPDQMKTWRRGSPGIFYRKGPFHESIAIGGKDQRWFWRLSNSWIAKTSGTFRFGFNNFTGNHFTHLDYQNLLYVNVSGQAGLEFHPVYHKGVFLGLGLHGGINMLPEVIPRVELGVAATLGIVLP